MLAFSVRRPYAWAIFYAGMDVEARDWPTRHRGQALIHAAAAVWQVDYAFFQRACRNSEHGLCRAIMVAEG